MEKQRFILLIDADFNHGNKLYFCSRMIEQATWPGLVSLGQYGIWDQYCLEVVLTKIFFNVIMRQKIWASAEGSFDAHTCYDRAVHNYRSMSWQAFGVLLCVTICMLMKIQLMEYFFQTAHGD